MTMTNILTISRIMKQIQVLSNKVSSISTVYTIFTLQKLFTWHTWFTLHNFGHKNKKEQG